MRTVQIDPIGDTGEAWLVSHRGGERVKVKLVERSLTPSEGDSIFPPTKEEKAEAAKAEPKTEQRQDPPATGGAQGGGSEGTAGGSQTAGGGAPSGGEGGSSGSAES